MEPVDQEATKLPANAYTQLGKGETYTPVINQENGILQVTLRSIVSGIAILVVFAAAATYIALKLGQGIETAIPIGILAVGLSAAFGAFGLRRSGLLENVNILAIGATSGIVVGGSVFVMPALFMLDLQGESLLTTFIQISLIPFLGSVLGVLFLIPFRKYFTQDMHGKLPFPEGTATLEILMAGQKGGSQAKVLVYSLGLGLVLDFLSLSCQAWSDTFTTAKIGFFEVATEKVKGVFAMNTSAAVMGLGIIIGPKYAGIILAGSMLATFVLVPFAGHLSPLYGVRAYDDIFFGFSDAGSRIPGVRNIGIGGIFAAGIISIIRMSPVIKQALMQVLAQVYRLIQRQDTREIKQSRLEMDIDMKWVVTMALTLMAMLYVYFQFMVMTGTEHPALYALVSLVLTVMVVFLFSAVSAWAVAMISVTPVSGMTLTALIIGAVVLSSMGLSGDSGKLAVLLIGGVVCTALSMTGSLVTQFKVGYWVGSTPKTIQWSNIIGSALASVLVCGVIMLFANVYGYGDPTALHPNPLPAPQASAMAAVAEAFLGGQGAPWMFYGLGAIIAVVVTLLDVSALAFALGMYLPIDLNSPIFLGACLGWFIQHSTKDAALAKVRSEKGILIASGLIAGGALAGVFDGLAKMAGLDLSMGIPDYIRNWLGAFVFLCLAVIVIGDSLRAKAEKKEEELVPVEEE